MPAVFHILSRSASCYLTSTPSSVLPLHNTLPNHSYSDPFTPSRNPATSPAISSRLPPPMFHPQPSSLARLGPNQTPSNKRLFTHPSTNTSYLCSPATNTLLPCSSSIGVESSISSSWDFCPSYHTLALASDQIELGSGCVATQSCDVDE